MLNTMPITTMMSTLAKDDNSDDIDEAIDYYKEDHDDEDAIDEDADYDDGSTNNDDDSD